MRPSSVWQDQPSFKLKPGEQNELIVWGEGEDPLKDGRSPVGATVLTAVSAESDRRRRCVASDRRQDLLLGGAAAVGLAERRCACCRMGGSSPMNGRAIREVVEVQGVPGRICEK